MTYKKICRNHFDDSSLRSYISRNGKKDICSICNKKINCLEIEKLAEHIESCLEYSYGDPYSLGAPYDKEQAYYEDSFPGVDVFTTEEILEEELDENEGDLSYEIAQHIDNSNWCRKDFFGPTEHEYFKGGWVHFKEILKHKVRFVFFDSQNQSLFEDHYHETLNPYYVMGEVGKTIKRLNLIKTFSKSELVVYRGRQHDKKEILDTAVALGAPPSRLAKANRMSPAGISMFYGGFEVKTCIEEIIDDNWIDSVISYGKFSNNQDLNLVDFTAITKAPSLFDQTNRGKRELVKFILEFIADLSEPVKPDDSVHIEYVPTQVVSEYLKLLFPEQIRIDGILYNSVKNKGGKCVALFLENKDCNDKYPKQILSAEDEDKLSKFFGDMNSDPTEIERILTLDNNSIQRENVKHTTKAICNAEFSG